MRYLNLNPFAQVYIDSAMEMLRQEIIGQEHVFRSQVRELHRLYWTQKSMMIQESKEKIIFSESSKGGCALDGSVGDLLKNHLKIFNRKLPAYDFIVGADTELSMSSRTFQPDCGNEVIDLEGSMDVQYHNATGACASGFRTQALCLFGSQLSMMGVDDSAVAAVNDLSCSEHGSRSVLIDLNMPNEDECYYVQNDHIVRIASPSANFSFDHHQILEPELTKSHADKSSLISKPESTIPASITSCKNRAKWLFPLNQDSVVLASQGSTLVHSANGNEVVSTRLSSTYEEDSINLSQIITRDSADKPRDHAGSEEDTQTSHSAAHHEAQPDEFSRNSCAEYNYIGMVNNSECSSYEKKFKEPATLSITDDSIITQLHSPKQENSYIVKPKIEVRDMAIAGAAEALMTIAFGRSEHFEISVEAEVQCDEPQNSSESFELMPMQLCEVQNEWQSPMAETSSLNETRKDANGVRLQRGRRLRDFRKEILPGLVSLSRHEICEDLYNIGYTLRKNTPKNARKNWFLPVRSSRRSRPYLRR